MEKVNGGGWWACMKTVAYIITGGAAIIASNGTLSLVIASLGYLDAVSD